MDFILLGLDPCYMSDTRGILHEIVVRIGGCLSYCGFHLLVFSFWLCLLRKEFLMNCFYSQAFGQGFNTWLCRNGTIVAYSSSRRHCLEQCG